MRIPVSSPWAPAAGWSVTARIPLISASASSSSQRSWSVPWATRRGERMEVGEAGQPGRPLVELRVPLHRARAERVEAGVDRVVELAQVDVVADDLGLVELGQRGGRRTAGRGRDPVEGVLRRVRDLAAAPPGPRLLEDRRLEAGPGDAHRPEPPRPAAAGRVRGRPGAGLDGDRRSPVERVGQGRREPGDLVRGGHLGRADEQRVGQRRVVGLGLGQDQARPGRRARAGAGGRAGASGTRTANSLRYGPRMEPRGADRGQRRLELGRPGGAQRGHVAQPVRADGREVDARGEGEERLVGADVAGRLLAPDVLLARAHRHDEGAPALEVGGHPDEPAGDLADERVGRGQDAEVRPAVLGRDAERLALAGGDVGAVLAGRREDGQRDRLDDRHEQRPGGMASRPISAIGSSRPRKFGWPATTPATGRSGSASSRSSAARSVVPAAGPSATSGISSTLRPPPRKYVAIVSR